MKSKKVIFAVGASGGHIFPALATAQVLKSRGVDSVFILGGEKFSEKITQEGFSVYMVKALPWNGKGKLAKLQALFALGFAVIKSMLFILKVRPAAVCGTGGYASVAPVLAGKLLFIKTYIHEQNVVPGMATRLLSRFVRTVCTTFDQTEKYLPKARGKILVTGSPVRRDVLAFFEKEHVRANDPVTVLVTGGSLGAHFLSESVPAALMGLSESLKKKLYVSHQARPEDVSAVVAAYKSHGISAEVLPFFDDMKERISGAHLVIARPGTSTVLEISLAGRAAIYIPHEVADGHQVINGEVVVDAGAGILLRQNDLEGTDLLQKTIQNLIENADERQRLEQGAKAFSQALGAERFADCILG
ncbi:MAG: undecaprenyldiphospho-muramoylpentapeptide beta-N-acetylglucosaminyltransferase [Alphaproteobacteria bacterium]|nr:undecaprenyldiphospho-muramoylpentapeptide beta-N-acetylglucosaminyltransferase [Alphaproteobacteria bacterium]